MYIITGHESFRSATTCTDPGVSYRNYLGTCIFVWEPMVNTALGDVILGGSSWLLTRRKQRKRSVSYYTVFYLRGIHALQVDVLLSPSCKIRF